MRRREEEKEREGNVDLEENRRKIKQNCPWNYRGHDAFIVVTMKALLVVMLYIVVAMVM